MASSPQGLRSLEHQLWLWYALALRGRLGMWAGDALPMGAT